MNFAGEATPLTRAGLMAAATEIGCDQATLWAVVEVETRGCGFLPDRRPVILFERHIFSRRTFKRFDGAYPDISNPDPGGYGGEGAHQYDRLAEAMELDPDAALKSASWGIGQIMGFNHLAAGYWRCASMIKDFCESEDRQLVGMARLILHEGLFGKLSRRDWTAFARGYNGPDFAKHDYHGRLAAAYERICAHGIPDLDVRAQQVRLMYAGLYTGKIDGIWGPKTAAALDAAERLGGAVA